MNNEARISVAVVCMSRSSNPDGAKNKNDAPNKSRLLLYVSGFFLKNVAVEPPSNVVLSNKITLRPNLNLKALSQIADDLQCLTVVGF